MLILGGAGNVGAYAVQIAHRAGARVIATASAGDLDYVRSLGADEAVDRNERLEDRAGPVDAVVDLVGGEAQAGSFAVLKRGGVRGLGCVGAGSGGSSASRREAGFFRGAN